ncbi:DNA repair protein RecO C-terminal domain-containing protein [Microbacterium sp. CH12i]|uniref:DNA repair protein RecO C-terminal domain-containing protein n=1 Tax=Microbacterium sp. CH12i TaxID=1479651 RepID=UPI0009DDD482
MTGRTSRALSASLDSLLAQGDPWVTIGERALIELLVELAPTGQGMAHLARYLRTTTARVADDADPQMPRQVQVLLRTIRGLGYNIELPRCARCGEEKLLVQTLHDGVRACATARRRPTRDVATNAVRSGRSASVVAG